MRRIRRRRAVGMGFSGAGAPSIWRPGAAISRRRDRSIGGRAGATKKGAGPLDPAPLVRFGAAGLVQRALDFLDGEALDEVALLDVLEALERHAAFLAGLDFVDLVLEALE